jgi:hypothetical protein
VRALVRHRGHGRPPVRVRGLRRRATDARPVGEETEPGGRHEDVVPVDDLHVPKVDGACVPLPGEATKPICVEVCGALASRGSGGWRRDGTFRAESTTVASSSVPQDLRLPDVPHAGPVPAVVAAPVGGGVPGRKGGTRPPTWEQAVARSRRAGT